MRKYIRPLMIVYKNDFETINICPRWCRI